MAPRDSFLLRIDPKVLDAVRRWADDDLRSVNGQMEFIIRRALKDAARTIKEDAAKPRKKAKKKKT